MKKIICGIFAAFILLGCLASCNYKLIDTTWNFDKAIISLPDGTIIEGEIEEWTDYSDGDQIQVKIDGVVYLVHSSDVVLMKE